MTRTCGNCMEFNGSYCTKLWNNLDESYRDVFRDSREPEDEACEDWEWYQEEREVARGE